MTLLAATALLIAYHAIVKNVAAPGLPKSPRGLAMFSSHACCRLSAGSLRKLERQHASHALASDAEHFANGMVGAVVVIVRLMVAALAKVFPIPRWLRGRADAIA